MGSENIQSKLNSCSLYTSFQYVLIIIIQGKVIVETFWIINFIELFTTSIFSPFPKHQNNILDIYRKTWTTCQNQLLWVCKAFVIWWRLFINKILFCRVLPPLTEKNHLNVAHGRAWSYYYGYLKMVLPGRQLVS